MEASWPRRGVLLLAVAGNSLLAAASRADELRVLAAGATESTLRAVVAEQEARGQRVQAAYGGVGQLRDRVVSGEPADVLVVTPAVIEQLEQKGLVRTGSRVDLGQVGGGVAVRAGEPRPPVRTPEELKQALLAAEEIYFPDPASTTAGAYLLSVADRLGVGAEVRRKAHTAPGGKKAMQLMAQSRGRAIGVTQVSEILSVKEVALVGPYPAPLQVKTTYSGVVLARAARPDEAAELLRLLASPPVQARFHEAGFEPMPAARPP
jgi:molybdate transport system substrate-binding protein